MEDDLLSAREASNVVQLLHAFSGEMSRRDLRDALGLKDDSHFRERYLLPAIRAKLVEMTIPDKPRSSNQR